MQNVVRLDRMRIGKVKRLDSGFLRVPITATRSGLFSYRRDNGQLWVELRPPEEVFSQTSMETLKGVPLTNEHPNGLLDTQNTTGLMVGYTGDEVSRLDDFLATFATITDGTTIAEVETKQKSEVSAGYLCDLELKPGTYKGQRYDAIQRNIRYNHVAITHSARGGSEVRIHLDSADEVIRLDSVSNPDETNRGEVMDKIIVIDGVEYKVPAEAATAINGRFAKDSGLIASATEEKTKATARADSLEADNVKLKEAVAKKTETRMDAAEFSAAVAKRVALEVFAAKRLDGEVSKMSDRDIIVGLIKLDSPQFNAEGKDDVYLQVRLDHIMETATEDDEERTDTDDESSDSDSDGAYQEAKKAISNKTRQDSKAPAKSHDEIRADSMRRAAEAWMKPIGLTRASK